MVRERAVLLKVKNVGKKFGGIRALSDCSFDIVQGELMGLIGPNGAGKTTVFNLLSGVLKPSSGEIFFNGKNITDYSPARTARAGIARTFQNIRLFGDLSVLDNIKVAFHMRHGTGFFHTVFHSAKFRRTEKEITRQAMKFAEMMDLSDLMNEPAKKLSYGDQRKMEIARALATNPKLLLLDEPAAGMNPQETTDLMATIKQVVADHGMTVLIVEHDMRLVMNLCHRIQVLNQGRVLARGTPEEIRNSPEVIKAYLGSPKEEAHAYS
ncbi:MAG: ABC transporter ATP-binding protein [Desulfobacteraceae bacterium]|nr:ABC transporter ATP-binding protein [Desulfobacteraceae bacterium]